MLISFLWIWIYGGKIICSDLGDYSNKGELRLTRSLIAPLGEWSTTKLLGCLKTELTENVLYNFENNFQFDLCVFWVAILMLLSCVFFLTKRKIGILLFLLLAYYIMAKKLNPKLEGPPKFTREGSYTVDEFLDKYDLMPALGHWDEKEQLQYLPFYLDKTALKWYQTIQHLTDWKTVRKQLKETFSKTFDRDFPEIRLHERVYNPATESLYAYYFDKLKLCFQVDPNMSNELKVKNILKNLPDNWNVHTLLNSNIKFDKLLQTLGNLDESIRKKPELTQPSGLTLGQVQQIFSSEFEKYKKEVNLDVTAVSEAAVAAIRKSGFMPPPDQMDRKAQFNNDECQICGKLGHKASRCFKRFNTSFNNDQEGYRASSNGSGYTRRDGPNRTENTYQNYNFRPNQGYNRPPQSGSWRNTDNQNQGNWQGGHS